MSTISSFQNLQPDNRNLPVYVLLSTHNGAAFVDEQIRSILNQQYGNLRLLVRDDGSSDATPDIVRRIAADDNRVTLVDGPRLGVNGSFFKLLDEVPQDAGYVAFADQDDVWLPTKLSAAIASLSTSRPSLYCSRATIANVDLHPLGSTRCWPKSPKFQNALVENIAIGCTIVINREAIILLQKSLPALGAVAHDWWCYLVVSAFGEIYFDNNSHILYRRHGSNASELVVSPVAMLGKRIRRQFQVDTYKLTLTQARQFKLNFEGKLNVETEKTLKLFLDNTTLLSRLTCIFGRAVYRQFLFEDIILQIQILFGGWGGLAYRWKPARKIA